VGKQNGFGTGLRQLRKQAGMTLAQLSKASNISTANISKAENGKISPTYDVLEKLARGLGITLSELVSADQRTAANDLPATARISIDQGAYPAPISSSQYDYIYLSTDLKSKQMVPIIMRLKANSIETFGELITHGGEEFVYVLQGSIEVHTEHYQPKKLRRGDSMYLDSRMGHGFIQSGKRSAEILTVATEPALPDGREIH